MFVFILTKEKSPRTIELCKEVNKVCRDAEVKIIDYNYHWETINATREVLILEERFTFNPSIFLSCYNAIRKEKEGTGVVVKEGDTIIMIGFNKVDFVQSMPKFIPFYRFLLLGLYTQLSEIIQWKEICSNQKEIMDIYSPFKQSIEKEDQHIYPIMKKQKQFITINKTIPILSIVICTYNNVEYLEWAIYSVLTQSFQDWELIIVNDGSTDKTTNLLKQYEKHPRIIVLENSRNMGKANSLTKALDYVSSDWLLELDADDWLAVDCLKEIAKNIANCSNDISLIYGNYIEWSERRRDKTLFYSTIIYGPKTFNLREYLEHPYPIAPRIYNVDHLKDIKGWKLEDISNARMFEDVFMLATLSRRSAFKYINAQLYHRRLRAKSITDQTNIPFATWKVWLLDYLSRGEK
ncbi:glycosyltransferase family 2 protein [Sutcliffiella cohnii]